MGCHPLNNPAFEPEKPKAYDSPNLNPMPGKSGPAPQAMVCDSEQDVFQLAQPGTPLKNFSILSGNPGTSLGASLLTAPLSGGASLMKSSLLFAPVAASPSLPPPPTSPMARLLYDITTQLKDFELTTTVKIPMEGINNYGSAQTITKAILGDKGALVALGMEIKPYAGPQSVLKPFEQVPIIGPFFIVRVMKVEMDPQTRHLKATVKWLCFPITRDVHEDYMKKAEIPSNLVKGPGYDLMQGVPLYSWQMLDAFLKILEAKGAEVAKNVGVDQVKPLFEKGEILIEGNFSNQTVKVGGLSLHFAPLAANQKHRIRVAGNLLHPVITVNGLKSAELSGSKGAVRLVNAEEGLQALEIQMHIDPTGNKPTLYEIPHYKSKRVFIETIPEGDPNNPIRLSMEEGIEMEGLLFRMDEKGPHLDIRKLAIKKMGFKGGGIDFSTAPGDRAILEDVHLQMVKGGPEFVAKITTNATGSLSIAKGDRELGFMSFKSLDGSGRLRVGPDEKGRTEIEIAGKAAALLPELRLLVQSEKMKASVNLKVQDATVSGAGRLRVWPEIREAVLETPQGGDAVTVEGKGGLIIFHQDPSEVAAWPELKKQLGDLDAKKVVTDFYVRPTSIKFSIDKMNLRSTETDGKATLEIVGADLSRIDIKGDLWGKLFTRLPGGIYFPIVIPQEAMMKNTTLRVERLLEQTNPQGGRSALFNQIVIGGEESQPTFSKKDQKRCGTDRQHIHAALGLFQFTEEREIKIQQVDPHFHVFLKNHIGGGCLKIE